MQSSPPCMCVLETLRQVTHLVSHNHRGASVDSQDWKLSLNGQEVKDLGNGLLIGAISKHDAMETSARKKLTHLCNHRLWVCLVHLQRDHGNIERIFGAPRWSEILVDNGARLAHDHAHAEPWGLLGCHRRHHMGK